MKKSIYDITLSYHYDANRQYTKYSIDNGNKWINGGEFKEVLLKHCKGYKPVKDENTAFDIGSDIPEENASVKSNHATITTANLGNNADEFSKNYFQRVSSKRFYYVTVIDDKCISYEMDKEEFKKFLSTFQEWDDKNKKLRLKKESGKMIQWLESNL